MLTPTGVTASAYWDAIKAGNIQHIRMTFTDGTVLDEQDVLSGGITIHDIMNGDTDLTFGKAVMKQLNVNFINSDRISAVQWASEFTLEMGVEIGGATNWVTVGVFRGERPDKIHYVDVIQFTAYDRMQMFETPADAFLNGLAYPKTFAQILSALCDYVGVSYVAGDELTNIKSRSFNAGFMSSDVITCRDLLAVMAEACGCYAKITATGGMRMTWFSSANHSVVADEEFQVEAFDIDDGMTWDEAEQYTWNEAEGFTWNDFGGYEEVFGVNGLVVKLTENDVGVSYGDTAGNVYLIVDNPFLVIDQDSDKTTYIQPIYNRLTAFGGYLPIRIECVGNWLIESGDVIIADVHGSNMSLPVFTNDLVWNGSCINTFESTGSKHREVVSSSNRVKLTNGGKYHELIVDIDQLHSEIGDRTGSSTTITQDIQNLDAVAQRKSSVWTSRSDPALTEPVQESDIWIRKRFKTWNEVKDYYATWNAVKADNDEWNSLFIEDMFYRRGGSWYKNYDAVGEFDTLNNKYTIRSGIHIEPEGVEIDGGKYLKLKSGSEIDINATGNLKLEGANVEIKSGSTFDVESDNLIVNSVNGYLANKAQYTAIDQSSFFYTTALGAIPTWKQGDVNFFIGSQSMNYLSNGNVIAKTYDALFRFVDKKSDTGTQHTAEMIYGTYYDGTEQEYYQRLWLHAIKMPNGGIPSFAKILLYIEGDIKVVENVSGNFGGNINCKNLKVLMNLEGNKIYYNSLIQNSSRDVKHNIQPLPSIGDRLDTLKPVTFVYDNDENEKQRMGLIYEDTIQTMPEICTDDESNKAINYVELIPALLKEIQDLRARVKQLEERGVN